MGAALAAPIFQGGALYHQEQAARAAYDVAAEQYRGTVLAAFQNVADTLVALDQDAKGLKAAAAADTAAKTTLDLVQRQLQDGYTNYLGLLSAQAAYQQARDRAGPGRGQSLRRHGRAVPGAGRRLVASRRSERGEQ